MADIAQKLHPDDQLVWGLWKSRFPSDLLWRLYLHPALADWEPLIPLDRHQGAPTWSWFSRLGQGRFSYSVQGPERTTLLAECKDIASDNEGVFPPNAVARLRGWLIVDWTHFMNLPPEHNIPSYEIPKRLNGTHFMPLLGDRYSHDRSIHVQGLFLQASSAAPPACTGRSCWERVYVATFYVSPKFKKLEEIQQETILLV